MTKLVFVFTIFLASSCSYLIKSYDEDIINQKGIKPLDETSKTYCAERSNLILVNDNEHSQKVFSQYIVNLEKKRLLSFIDKVVLWSFAQMNLRPDLSSPTSKLQILIKTNKEDKYFLSYSESDESYPYLHLLSQLLRQFGSRYSISELAQIYDRGAPRSMKVSLGLSEFLSLNQNRISSSNELKRFFLRGDEPLREKEGLPFLGAKKMVNLYSRSKKKVKYEIKSHLFSKFQQNSSFVPQCNFDMNLYKDSLFLISEEKVRANTFGLKDGKNVFLASSSQRIETYKSIAGTIAISGDSDVRPASLCTYKKRLEPQESLWLISSESRDPGQHLYHLQEYGLHQVESVPDFDKLLRFSRHLFLRNPVRLIIESRRSQEDQIRELLKLDIPIFNAKKLGKIWGFYENDSDASFLLDVREQGFIKCLEK